MLLHHVLGMNLYVLNMVTMMIYLKIITLLEGTVIHLLIHLFLIIIEYKAALYL